MNIYSQEMGSLFKQNYHPKEYNGEPQCWGIIEDNRGITYVATQGGLLEFDGTNWRKILIEGNTEIRSIAKDKKGTIYVGGLNEFGFLKPNIQGRIIYESLTHLLDSTEIGFGRIWSICTRKDEVFFQSRSNLFRLRNNAIKQWEIPNSYHRGYVINNEYYLRLDSIGLTIFRNDSLQLVKGGELFANEIISAMLPFSENKILIGSRTQGLFLYDTKNKVMPFMVFKNEANIFFKKYNIYHGISVQENNFAFATLQKGVVIITREGKTSLFADKNKGLIGNEVYYLLNHHNQFLWVTTSSGISRIDIGTPIEFWNFESSFLSRPKNVIVFNNILYIGTFNGIYYWNRNKSHNKFEKHSFEKVNGISGLIWDFRIIEPPCEGLNKRQLFVSNRTGINKLINDQSYLIYQTITPCVDFIQLKQEPDKIIYCIENGVYLWNFNCTTGRWGNAKEIIHLILPSELKEDHFSNLWIGTYNETIYKYNLEKSLLMHTWKDSTEGNFKKINNESGLPSGDISIYEINNNIYIFSGQGVFKYNKQTNTLSPDTMFNNQLRKDNLSVFRLVKDKHNNLWIDGSVGLIKQKDNTFIIDTISLKRTQKFINSGGYCEKNGIIWFVGEHLIRFDSNKENIWNIPYHTILREIRIGKDSLVHTGAYYNDSLRVSLTQLEKTVPEIDYKYNTLTFNFSAPYYVEQDDITYSYMLEGAGIAWSEWSGETKKEYTFLHEGKYNFKVKAKNIYNAESSIASYQFSIRPPWYRSILAYFSYLISLVFLILLILKIYTKRLKNANIHLENIVKKRTIEIREKNIELSKLSIVASETDNAITIMDAEGNFEWFNDGFTRLHGFTLEEYIKAKDKNLVHSSTNPDIKKIILQCINEKIPVIYQSFNISKVGEKIWTQSTLTPILDQNGNIDKLVTIEADIRKIKKYEEEILQKNEEILQKNEEILQKSEEIATQRDSLAESNATKDKFFAIISHDLKSPFNAILGFAEMLDENISILSKEKIAKFNSQIFTSAKQLYSLIENLLSWSRAKSGKIKSYPEILDMQKLIDNTCSIMQISAEKKDIRIHLEIPSETFVYVDENLISTVVRNLLSNAIKYSREKSIITIKAINKPDIIEISIIDSGVGIKKEDISKLFRENFHFTTQGTNQEKGTGLGLILCQDFVKKSGGKIWVDSEEDKGTTFSFSLPKPSESTM